MPRINFGLTNAKSRVSYLRWLSNNAWSYAATKGIDSIAGDDAELLAMEADEEAAIIIQDIKDGKYD